VRQLALPNEPESARIHDATPLDFVALPAEILALRPPLAVVLAIAQSLATGARVVYPPLRPRMSRNVYVEIELILAIGQDRSGLKSAGFKTGLYPNLRRMTWRR
jgi:hypothetical protein